MAAYAEGRSNVEKLEFVWSQDGLCSQSATNTHDLDLIFSTHGQPAYQHLRNKWFSNFETTSKPKLSTTGLLAFSVITASQGYHQLRDSLQVALTILSAKDHERYFQRIPALSQHRIMFRAYVDLCLKFINICDSKTGDLNSDTEVVVVWCSLLEPLGEMLNLILKDHLQRTNNQWLMNIPKPYNLDEITESLKNFKDDGIYEQFYNYDFEGDQRFQNGVQQILARLEGGKEQAGQQSLDLLLQAKLFYFSRFYFEIELDGYEAWLNKKCKEELIPVENDDTSAEEVQLISEANEEVNEQESLDMASDEEPSDVGSEEVRPITTEDPDTDPLTDEEKVRKIGDSDKQQPSSAGLAIEAMAASSETKSDMLNSVSDTSSPTELLQQTPNSTIEASSNSNMNVTIDLKENDRPTATAESGDNRMYPTSFMHMLQLLQEGKGIPGVEHLVVEPTNNPPTESNMQRTPKPWEK